MMDNRKKDIFKYNMSFYYQSTIVYFVVFILYLLIRGEFFEDSFTLITRDPIIYFFGLIVLISLVSLLYNLYKNRHLEIDAEGFTFTSRNKHRTFKLAEISDLKLSRRKRRAGIFRLIRIRLKNRRRPLLIRPYDYEREEELIKKFQELKAEIESKNV